MSPGAARVLAVSLVCLLLTGCLALPTHSLTAVVFSGTALNAALAVENVGGVVSHKFPLINAVGTVLSSRQLEQLATDEHVERVVVSENLDSTLASNERSSEVGSWLDASKSRRSVNPQLMRYIGVDKHGLTGKGVGIALIDTGLEPISQRDDGSPSIVEGYNAIMKTEGSVPDHSGHGTHLASLLTGFGDSFKGIAPNASVIPIKAFNTEDEANVLDVIDGIQWAVDHRKRYNLKVLNLSMSASAQLPYTIDPLNRALTAAWNAGLVVVVSAGNDGPAAGSVTAPGNNPWLISVGAADFQDTKGWRDVAPFSGRGPTRSGHIKPDILAPGTLLAGVLPVNAKRPATEAVNMDLEGYWVASGASQATAVASGIIALLLESRPELSNHDVKCLLANTAGPLSTNEGEIVSLFTQGRGLMNLQGALASAQTLCEERLEGIDPDTALEGAFKGR
ncbi:MAG: S8 family serine peptidase [Luminiphilus sp.]|nr:S8 family serine peptidase [Luminiphilus sp.]